MEEIGSEEPLILLITFPRLILFTTLVIKVIKIFKCITACKLVPLEETFPFKNCNFSKSRDSERGKVRM